MRLQLVSIGFLFLCNFAGASEWAEVDQLISNQRVAEAEKKIGQILVGAKESKNESLWLEALVRGAKSRMVKGEVEGAIGFLRKEPWPQSVISQSILSLTYAEALQTYFRTYSWEIRNREKISVESKDLKKWTMEQFSQEIEKTLQSVWQNRVALGSVNLDQLSSYLTKNNYPENVRPTFRSSISYLYAEFLSDSGWYSAKEAAALQGFSPANLWKGQALLGESNSHPMIQALAVLRDLQQWHESQQRREGALEAALESFRILHANFFEKSDREEIRMLLTQHLHGFVVFSWWSMGKYQLARFYQEATDLPDYLVKAVAEAEAGRARFPDSPGGKNNQIFISQIQAPVFSITMMRNDGLKKNSIAIQSKNLNKIYFRAYPFPMSEVLSGEGSQNQLWVNNETLARLSKSNPIASWSEALPVPGDYLMHASKSTPQINSFGDYVIVASSDPSFSSSSDVSAGLFSLGNLFVTTQMQEGKLEVRAFEAEIGNPLKDVKLALYEVRNDGSGKLRKTEFSGDTDEQGKFVFSKLVSPNRSYWLVAEKGASRIVIPEGIYFYRNGIEQEQISSVVYKDRSVFRPQQKVFWKVVSFKGKLSKGKVSTYTHQPITVQLFDVNGKEVDKVQGATNAFGTFSGEFKIPPGRALGNWQIRTSHNGYSSLQVEEYKRPTFFAELKDPTHPYRLEKTARIAGQAKYYFGAPVTNGFVKWKVTRTAIRPFWWCWDWGMVQSPFVIASGSTDVDSKGDFQFDFFPKGDKKIQHREGSLKYQFHVAIDLTDAGGETHGASKSFLIGDATLEAEFQFNANFMLEGESGKIILQRKSLAGIGKSGEGAWKISSLKMPAAAQMPSEFSQVSLACGVRCTEWDQKATRGSTGFHWQSVVRDWKVDKELSSGISKHDEKGDFKLVWPKLGAGVYRLQYQTKDDQGVFVRAEQDFLVAGAAVRLPLPGLLLIEKAQYAVGEKAKIWAYSGFPGQAQIIKTYLSALEENDRVIQSGRDQMLWEIPVTEAMRGGFSVSSTLVHDHQMLATTENVSVPWSNKTLPIRFSHIREKIRPGDREKWTISLKDPLATKKKSEVEVLAWMVDKSLEIFGSNDVPSLLNLFPSYSAYPNLQSSQSIASLNFIFARPNLISSPTIFSGDSWNVWDQNGIGGMGRRSSGIYPSEQFSESMPMANARREEKSSRAAGAPMALISADGAMQKSSAKSASEGLSVSPAEKQAPATALRSDFSETAFWMPHLLLNSAGSVSLEFTVPDSITSWNVLVHALAPDLRSGLAQTIVASSKDLMIRPYLPRFFREGDRVELQLVVNNTSKQEMSGNTELLILDPATGADLSKTFQLEVINSSGFHVAAQESSTVRYSLLVPPGIREVQVKATAKAKDYSDGELRVLPVLPGRMHLIQSKFAILKNESKAVLDFSNSLVNQKDETRIQEKLVVSVQAQLFYDVLQSLPYLLNYSYESMDVHLDRWVSAGILSRIYETTPAIKNMARKLSKRSSQLESWNQADPNRRLMLEESPWMVASEGGDSPSGNILNLLNPEVVAKVKSDSLNRLQEMQQPNGGFSWWNGAPASPDMTLAFLLESSRAAEFGVEIPKEMTQRAWQFIASEFQQRWLGEIQRNIAPLDLMVRLSLALQLLPDLSFTNGVVSESDRSVILEYSFKNWKKCSPYLKGMLTLALKHGNRMKDAEQVFASVMDAAKTSAELGVFWAPEDRSWLWYNDTIESHAFALRVLSELYPKDPRRDGLVQWLLLNKKLNHWKSSRSTSEVIYSLAYYMKAEKALAVKEEIKVKVGGIESSFTFDPAEYSGKNQQVVIEGSRVLPEKMAKIEVKKTGKGFAFASASWQFSTEKFPSEPSGDLFFIDRKYFRKKMGKVEVELEPLNEGAVVRVGEEVEVHLSVNAKHEAEYVHLRDPRPAGFEPIALASGYRGALGIGWYEEVRDSATGFFFERLPVGDFPLKYSLRASIAGVFRANPATLESLYAPEFAAYSSGRLWTIQK